MVWIPAIPIWKGLLLRGIPIRIPNHRAPNHHFTIIVDTNHRTNKSKFNKFNPITDPWDWYIYLCIYHKSQPFMDRCLYLTRPMGIRNGNVATRHSHWPLCPSPCQVWDRLWQKAQEESRLTIFGCKNSHWFSGRGCFRKWWVSPTTMGFHPKALLKGDIPNISQYINTHYIRLDVSENSGFSIINHPFWGTPIFGNTHVNNEKYLIVCNNDHVQKGVTCSKPSCVQDIFQGITIWAMKKTWLFRVYIGDGATQHYPTICGL